MSRMALDLMLEAHGEAIVVLKVCWLPYSKTELAIVTNQFVKIYDLAIDRICPSRYLQTSQGVIADAVFELKRSTSAPSTAGRGSPSPAAGPVGQRLCPTYRLWVLVASPPTLYYQDIGAEAAEGPVVLHRRVALPLPTSGGSGAAPRVGLCLLCSQRTGSLLVSFDEGLLVTGSAAQDGETLDNARVFQLPVREQRAVAYSQLFEWEHVPGFYVGWSRKQNAVHAIHIAGVNQATPNAASGSSAGSGSGHSITPVAMPPGSSRSTFEGVALWSQSPEAARLAVLMEDGSLHLYNLRRRASGAANGGPGSLAIERLARMAASHRSSPREAPREPALEAPPTTTAAAAAAAAGRPLQPSLPKALEFPRDFFEHTVHLTADAALAKEVSIAGDALQYLSAEVIRQRLGAQNEEALPCEVPSEDSEGFTLEVRLASRKRWVPAGVRLLLGHIQRGAGAAGASVLGPGPTSVRLGESGRRVTFWGPEAAAPLPPACRRWFDVPLAPWESQACMARRPVGLTLIFSAPGPFVIDALEVYAIPFASFPRQLEAPAGPTQWDSQGNERGSNLLLCTAVDLAGAWFGEAPRPPPIGGLAAAQEEPLTVARGAVLTALACLASLPCGAAGGTAIVPEVRAAAALWEDAALVRSAERSLAALLPQGGAALPAQRMLVAADAFLACAAASNAQQNVGWVPLPLIAAAAEWCSQVLTNEDGCRSLLQQRPAFVEVLGASVRAVVVHPFSLHLCPQAVLHTLTAAAVTAALLQLKVRLEDCFTGPAAAGAEMPRDATESLWHAFCESQENTPHVESLAFFLTAPSSAVRDASLRALLGFLGLSRASTEAPLAAGIATSATSSSSSAVPGPATSETKECASDGSSVEGDEEEAIPAAGTLAATLAATETPVPVPDVDAAGTAAGSPPNATAETAAAPPPAANVGAALLPLMLLAYFSSATQLNQASFARLRSGSLTLSACLFELSQRLVLACLDTDGAASAICTSCRGADLLRLVLSERAEGLAKAIMTLVHGRFAAVHDVTTGRPLQPLSAGAMEVTPEQDAGAGVSEEFLHACVCLLGAQLASLLRARGRSRVASVAEDVLLAFVPTGVALLLPLFAVLQRTAAMIAGGGHGVDHEDSGGVFPATGGQPPPASEAGLLQPPLDVPASHMQALLPTTWQEACEAEGCHALEHPQEALGVAALGLLSLLLHLPRTGPPEVVGTAGATLAEFAVTLSKEVPSNAVAVQATAAPAATAARACGAVLTQLALLGGYDGGGVDVGGHGEKGIAMPGAVAMAAGARNLLQQLCGSRRPYHRLLDFALFARVRDSLQPHMERAMSGGSTVTDWHLHVDHIQATAFVEACTAWWDVAKQRPWTWAQYTAVEPQLLEYCLAVGQALAAKYGRVPFRVAEVAENCTIPFRLLSLALAAPGTSALPPKAMQCPAEVFRQTIEAAMCALSEDLRQSASVALALLWDRHCALPAPEQSGSAHVLEVSAILRRAVEALLPALGARGAELAGLAAHVLLGGGELGGQKASPVAGVTGLGDLVASLGGHLCRVHKHCGVPLQRSHMTVSVDEVAVRAKAIQAAMSDSSAAEGSSCGALGSGAAAATAPGGNSGAREAPKTGGAAASSLVTGAAASSSGLGASEGTNQAKVPVTVAAGRSSHSCSNCTELALPLTRVRLESLRAEQKFSDDRMWVRFGEAISISAVGVVMHEHLLRQGGCGRHIGRVRVYFNTVSVQDVATLKARSHLQGWQPLCQLFFEPVREGLFGNAPKAAATEVTAKLLVPVTVCNLLFEYSEGSGPFGSLGLDNSRSLVCPRCHRPAGKGETGWLSAAGICLQCGDNAFQCPKCRNINYEKLDAPFCNDCGYCRFAKMETWLTCRFTHERHVGQLRNEADCRRASQTLEGLVKQLRSLPEPASTSGGGSTSTAPNSRPGPNTVGGVPAPASPVAVTTALGQGVAVIWRPASGSLREGFRRGGAASAEEVQAKLCCSVADVRQKVLQYRRSHPYAPVGRPPGAGTLSAIAASAAAARSTCSAAPLVCSSCEACMLTVLICDLQLLGRALELAALSDAETKAVLAAMDASAPEGFCLLQDFLLPVTLRCAALEARIAGRRVLLALAALSPRYDSLLCAALDRSVRQSALTSSPVALWMVAETMREEARLLLELLLASKRLSRLRLLASMLEVGVSSQNPVATMQVLMPCMLLAVRLARNLPKASAADTWAMHLHGLLFTSFSGPLLGPKGSALRDGAAAAAAISQWRARLHLRRRRVGTGGSRLGVAPAAWPDLYHSKHDWMLPVLTHGSSQRVRHMGRELFVALLATQQPGSGAALQVLARLRVAVLEAAPPRPSADAALQLAHGLLAEPGQWARRLGCAATGWLPLLRQFIRDESATLVPIASGALDSEGALWSEMSVFPTWLEVQQTQPSHAESLVWALRLLHLMLAEPMLALHRRRQGLELTECVLTSLLDVRAAQQSHLLQSAHLVEASSLLERALQQLQEEAPPLGRESLGGSAASSGAEQQFLAACIRTLRNDSLVRKMRLLGLPLSLATRFAFEQIAGLLCPEQRERAVLLHIQKASTQEEYIRGQMRKNPYVSTEIGPTVRHIREKICSDLNIRDAIEIMELLVGDKILGLDLPIAQVYDQVWVPFVVARRERLAEQAAAERGVADRLEAGGVGVAGGGGGGAASPGSEAVQASWEIPPMTIIFRLSGVDGEATEDRVEALVDTASEAVALQEAERRKRLCRTFGELGGVAAAVECLEAAVAERGQEGCLEVLDVLSRISHACCEVEATRQQLVDLGGLRALLLHLLRTIDEMCGGGQAEQLGPLQARVAERLLGLVESLAREGGSLLQQCFQQPRAQATGAHTAEEHVSLLLSLLCQQEPGGGAGGSTLVAVGGEEQSAAPPWARKMRTQVASLLPFLTFGQPAPIELLVRASMPLPLPAAPAASPGSAVTSGGSSPIAAVSPSEGGAPQRALSLDLVIALVEHVPSDPAIGETIRAAFLRAGAVHELLGYLERIFPLTSCNKNSAEWVAACQAPGLPAALRLLAGLVAGFGDAQRLVARHEGGRLLKLFFQLESTAVSSMQSGGSSEAGGAGAQVGSHAEGALEALKRGNPVVAREIDSLRLQQRSAKSSRANQSREKVLRALGMSVSKTLSQPDMSPVAGGDRPQEASPRILREGVGGAGAAMGTAGGAAASASGELASFEDVEEDLRCCVCQEGYHFQPEEVLCAYTFVKPMAVNAAQTSPEPRGEGPQAYRVTSRFGLCSVSHFTVIHWQCHQSATRAAANLRPKPQGEWESATVRNSSSKCNALIPVLGPSLPEASVEQSLERYFGHLAQVAKGNAQSVLGRRAVCLLHDFRLCFTRLACQESFSTDTGGGGPRHNMCLAFVMLQLLCHESLAGELTQELSDLEQCCVEPLLAFREPAEAARTLERFRLPGQVDGVHLGHLWTLCTISAFLRAGTPGGGSSLEWSAGTLWRLLALALEVTRRHGPLRFDQRKSTTPQVRPGASPHCSPARWAGAAASSPLHAPHLAELSKLPKLTLEPCVEETVEEEVEAPDKQLGDVELSLLADAVPLLRFLMLVDIWRWRLERWSRGAGGAGPDVPEEAVAGAAAGSSCVGTGGSGTAGAASEALLGTPLLSRLPLRQRLRRFDGGVLEASDAVAHLFSALTSPTALWHFFLFRLGDPGTLEFCPKLAPHAGGTSPLELLCPPRLKADPSLVEVAVLPSYVLKSAAGAPSSMPT